MVETEKNTVEHFIDFEMKDGKFVGTDTYGNEYEIKDLLRKGNGDCWVTYYVDDEEELLLQDQKDMFRSERVYGKITD